MGCCESAPNQDFSVSKRRTTLPPLARPSTSTSSSVKPYVKPTQQQRKLVPQSYSEIRIGETIKISIHPHELTRKVLEARKSPETIEIPTDLADMQVYEEEDELWLCDNTGEHGITQGCISQQVDFAENEGEAAYTCEQCDYDLCEPCVQFVLWHEMRGMPLIMKNP